jgi:hypothetical protein
MANRLDPWAGLTMRRIPAQPTASLSTWEQLAAFHGNERNKTVVQVLLNAAVVKQMRRLELRAVSASLMPDAEAYDDETVEDLDPTGAVWQLPGGIQPTMTIPAVWQERLDGLQADEAVRERFRVKATSPVEAHCIPCAVEFDGVLLESLMEQALTACPRADPEMGIVAARTPFGNIDVLPLIFNEADSHAERVGLKRALVDACQSLPTGMSSPSGAEIFGRVERGYHQWKVRAVAALEETIKRNRDRLARARSSGNTMQIIYREARLVILEGYRHTTDTVTPDLLDREYISTLYACVSALVRSP